MILKCLYMSKSIAYNENEKDRKYFTNLWNKIYETFNEYVHCQSKDGITTLNMHVHSRKQFLIAKRRIKKIMRELNIPKQYQKFNKFKAKKN